jgi:hypothetical protein
LQKINFCHRLAFVKSIVHMVAGLLSLCLMVLPVLFGYHVAHHHDAISFGEFDGLEIVQDNSNCDLCDLYNSQLTTFIESAFSLRIVFFHLTIQLSSDHDLLGAIQGFNFVRGPPQY